jgi:hypothetical protein
MAMAPLTHTSLIAWRSASFAGPKPVRVARCHPESGGRSIFFAWRKVLAGRNFPAGSLQFAGTFWSNPT